MSRTEAPPTRLLKALTAVNVGVLAVNLLVSVESDSGRRTLDRTTSSLESLSADATESLAARRDRVAGGASDRVQLAKGIAPQDKAGSPALRVELTDEQLHEVLNHIYRRERLWRRTSAVMHGLDRLQEKGVLPSLGKPGRERIIALAREYADRRAELELAVMNADVPMIRTLQDDLIAFDHQEVERIARELNTFLNPADARRVVRTVVPGTG